MYRKMFTLSRLILVITVAAILIILAGCSSTSSPTTPAATTPATTSAATTTASTSRVPSTSPSPSLSVSPTASYTVNISQSTTLGNYLVDGNGMTLYFTTRDSVGKSNITGTTLANWPVFSATSIAVPSTLKASDFGTITRDDGSKQTTFKGWPLYFYINDKAPGDTKGNGVGGVWFVIDPANFPPTPSPSPTTSAAASGSPSSSSAAGGPVTINLTAQNFAFNMKTITVPAGSKVTINFNNMDSGIPHNFAAYTDQSAAKSIYVGQIVTGPATMTYTFTAPTTPGTYFFRCDVHPTQMTGQLIVQ